MKNKVPRPTLGLLRHPADAQREVAVIDNLSGKLYLIVYADQRSGDVQQRQEAPGQRCAGGALFWSARCLRARSSDFRPSVNLPRPDASRGARQELIAAGGFMQVQVGQRIKRTESPLSAIPRAALAEHVAVHDLLRLRRLSGGERVARDSGAARARLKAASPSPPWPARRGAARVGQATETDWCTERPQGARRARHADRLIARSDIGRIAKTGSVKVFLYSSV